MTEPEQLPDGKLRVPRRAEGPDGLIGDGMVVIGPDDPEYEDWLAWLRRDRSMDGYRP